ncbi:MAG: flagellar basal body rod protein FlgC [Pseudomonadota bacterium]
MSLFSAIDTAATALEAQSVRLNTISSNLANAGAVARTPEEAYRAQYVVFETMYQGAMGEMEGASNGVQVSEVVLSDLPPRKEYVPSHPLADEEGFIYRSTVNSVEEIANMIEASRNYQSNIEAMNTTKQLILRTLTLGR